MKKLLLLTVAAALSAACIQVPEMPQLPQDVPAAVQEPQPAVVLDLEIPLAQEKAAVWKSADHKGKPVLIAFMGTWCPWCKRSLPALDAAKEKFNGQVEVVGAFVDEELPTVLAVVKQHDMKTKALYSAGDAAGEMGVQGFPHIMLFDKNHKLVKVWSGYSPALEQEFTVQITEALK